MSETIIHNQIRIVSPSAPVLDASAMSEQVWRALALSLESIAAQIVEAQRYMESNEQIGKIVVTVAHRFPDCASTKS